MATTENAIISAAISLNPSLATRFCYRLQCKHPEHGWCYWMPDDKMKEFAFKHDAIAEMKQHKAEGSVYAWRILFCAVIEEVI